ncbi:hypothetical protein MLD38_022242 [Melastoma candidum]|uniref:Uncharacterized protein n=1 Tax=Melastoma candidum TaxID=119954 RepID=A0ACB9QIM3_9MYRT|nr:hypothetical protein MLD38_022242 [Melastoma candidum]
MDTSVGDYGGGVVVRKRTKRLPSRNWKLESFFRVSGIAVISLFLLSHYSSGVSAAGEFLKRLVSHSSKPLHVFFVGNVIVLAIVVLSGIDADSLRIGRGKKGRGGVVMYGIYDEYVARCRATIGRGNDLELLPEAGDVPEVEKQISLFSSPVASIEGGKGSLTVAAAACDRCTRDGCSRKGMKAERSLDIASPCGRGRLVLHGAVGGHALGEPADAARDGSTSNDPPEKFTGEAKLNRTERLALPDIIMPSLAATSDSSKAKKHIIPKSLSKTSINRKKALPKIAAAVRHGGLKNSPRQREMEAERSADIAAAVRHGGLKNSPWQREMEAERSADTPSPRRRGRLVAVRGDGIRMGDHMSIDEFNRNVEKYIAKTWRFIQEESTREINHIG